MQGNMWLAGFLLVLFILAGGCGEEDGFPPVLGLGDHFQIFFLLQKLPRTLPYKRVIVGQQDPDLLHTASSFNASLHLILSSGPTPMAPYYIIGCRW